MMTLWKELVQIGPLRLATLCEREQTGLASIHSAGFTLSSIKTSGTIIPPPITILFATIFPLSLSPLDVLTHSTTYKTTGAVLYIYLGTTGEVTAFCV